MVFFLCLLLPGLLLCIPAMMLVLWWYWRSKESEPSDTSFDSEDEGPRHHPFPLTAVGAALMGLSFVTLPWLSIKPLERIGLEWLHDVAPFVGRLLSLLKIDNLDRLLPVWKLIGIRPPGWLALALNAQTWGGLFWLFFGAIVVGGFLYLLAHWVAAARKPKYTAPALAAMTIVLSLLLLYQLPDIDGLGEHDFSNVIALIVPVILNVHISAVGPFVMVVGLALLLVGGILRAQE